MSMFRPDYWIFLRVFLIALGLAMVADIPAISQETEPSRQLERVEIEAPQRRPAPRATTTPASGADYDQPPPTDSPSSADRGDRSQTFSGTDIPASTLSLVEGKSQVSLGAESLPAQVQTVTSQDIQQLNVRGDYANLFGRTAGVKAINYGQGQIGTAISMRGFTSSVGQEVGVFVDGVPQNMPSAVQTTGRTELSWLNPDVIERIETIKGPVSAMYGNFALAGVVNIVTKRSEPSPSVSSYGGSFGAMRVFGVVSDQRWVPTPYLAHEYYTIDGYRDNSQLKQWSPFNKVSFPMLGGIASLR